MNKRWSIRQAKARKCKPATTFRQAFVVSGQAAEARGPGKGALDDPAPGQQHEAALGLRQLDHLQPDAVRRRIGGRVAHRCSPGRRRPVRPSARSPPAPPRPTRDLARSWALAGVTSSASSSPSVSTASMDLAALAPLVARRSRRDARSLASIAAWRCRRSPPWVGRRGPPPSAASRAGRAPSPQSSPPRASAASAGRPPARAANRPADSARGAGAHDPAQGIEDLAQVMAALRGIVGHQGQIGGDKGPFLVSHIGRVRFAGENLSFHPPSVPSP